MSKSIVEFDELQAAITAMVEPTKAITVKDAQSGQMATEALKQVKDYVNRVEKMRKSLVGPLNDRVKQINDYAKAIVAPIQASEIHLKAQLSLYEMELEKVRREQAARLEEERKRKEAELLAQQEAERKAVAAQATVEDEWFGAGPESTQAVAQVEIKHAEERAVLEGKIREQAWDIKQQRVSNARKVWKCEATDLSKVPREFLTITLNTQAVLAAARGGVTEIPGVRLWQEVSIAVGRNTYIPQAMLAGTKEEED